MEPTIKNRMEPAGKNMLFELWFRYFPYWPVFVVLIVLALSGTYFYLLHKVSVFESSATILIKDERKGLDNSKMIESLNSLSVKKIIENEIEVIRSRSLMIEVVNKLHLYAPISQDGKFKAVSAYRTSPIKIEVKNPDSVSEFARVDFSYDSAQHEVVIDNTRYTLDTWHTTTFGTLRFTLNNAVAPATGTEKLYFSLIDPRKITAGLLAGLDVSSASKLSTVIVLKIRDEVPSRAEDILNELIAVYNKAGISDKNALAVNTLAFVEERLQHVVHELDSIENHIQKYKSNRGAIDISAQGRMYLQNVSDNDQKLGDIKMKLAVLDQVEKYVESKDSRGGIVPSTLGVDDPMLSQLLEKLYNSELEYEKLKTTVGENHTMLISVVDRIRKIKPGIMENIHNQRSGLLAGLNNLSNTNHTYTSQLSNIPQKERELVEISREQTIKNSIYSFLLQKKEEAALSHSSTVADSRVVDKAQSSFVPVSPNKRLFYLIAIVGSFGICIVLLAANEAFSKKIMFRKEIETYTSTPIIAEIAFEKLENDIVVGPDGNRFMLEQFRKLRATLPHIGINYKRKKMLITSTISGEGKSFVSVNLALSLALTGKKVVLVEFDMTNPTLSKKLNQYPDKGLSEYLESEDVEPEEIIKRTAINENLFFISSGQLPENPSELITRDKVQVLLHFLDAIFDYVIIDSAPAGPSSDAYILSPLCDVTLYIIRHRYTPRVLVQRMDENNSTAQLKGMAIIFNGIRSRGFRKNNYGYGYGYGYGHNYYTKTAGRSDKKIPV
jgi:capsular exopolysaccharide synthesis family protein